MDPVAVNVDVTLYRPPFINSGDPVVCASLIAACTATVSSAIPSPTAPNCIGEIPDGVAT